MFLCDGDALCLANHKLLTILDYIRDNFPECQRVTTYGRAADALRKTDEELKELKDHGLTMVYIGAESGSDKVLQKVNKGETRPVSYTHLDVYKRQAQDPDLTCTGKDIAGPEASYQGVRSWKMLPLR